MPPGVACYGSYLSEGVILMPGFVNIGAWVGPRTMVDTWATVGSFAQIGADGQYRVDMPDFMVFLDWKAFPWHWTWSEHFLWAMFLVVAVPGLLAFVFGYFAFRSRVKGVYFSIITQALTYAAMLLFFRNATGFG